MTIHLDAGAAIVLITLIICLTLIALIALARPRKDPRDRTSKYDGPTD